MPQFDKEKVRSLKNKIRMVLQKYDDEKLARRLDQQTDAQNLDKKKRNAAHVRAGEMTDTAIEDLAETILSGGGQ